MYTAAGDYSDEDEAAAPAAGAPEPAVAEAEAAGEADESMPPAFIDRGNNAAMVLQAHAGECEPQVSHVQATLSQASSRGPCPRGPLAAKHTACS